MSRDGGSSARLVRQAAVAGHLQDEGTARTLKKNASGAVRVAALGALARMDALTDIDLAAALADDDPTVRRRACELAVPRPAVDLLRLLDDPDHRVVESAAWALGERGSAPQPAAPSSAGTIVEALARVATGHEDALSREAAVAALGALGDVRGLPAILAATEDRATVRRRAVLALAPFSGDEVEAALRRAREDRDWQVRQAAEDLLDDD